MGFLFVLSQAHRWVLEHVRPGDAVIDATAGNGVDTLFLARAAGAGGQVYAFDIQAAALAATRERLGAAGSSGEAPPSIAPVELLLCGHERMAERIPSRHHGHIGAIMFNLGYLPGAEQRLITRTDTTLAALNAGLSLLRSGGILTIVVYPGHEGGREEADAVTQWAAALSPELAQSVIYRFLQKDASPYLVALTKK